jgi:FkbM family methyltransferase
MPNIVITEYNGIRMAYRLGSVDEQVICDTIVDDIFFKGTPEYVPKSDDILIDVGAHIGAFSILAATRVPYGRIYAIEPSQESFELLEQNVQLNRCSNIIPIKKALHDRKGEIKLFHDIELGNWGHSIVKEFSTEGEMVQCDTLERFFVENRIQVCNFIKFNCEGAEFSILLSAPIATLKKIENILILYHCDLETKYGLDELAQHLKKANFILVKRFQFGERGWIIGHRNLLRHVLLSTKHRIKKLIDFRRWS